MAARERFPGRAIADSDGDLWLVHLEAMPSSLHLTHQTNLDALAVADRGSTGRVDIQDSRDPDPLFDTCSRLSDAIYDWWKRRPPPLVYRARTAPARRNIAFTAAPPPRVTLAGRLRDATALHTHLVLRAGFTVPTDWLR